MFEIIGEIVEVYFLFRDGKVVPFLFNYFVIIASYEVNQSHRKSRIMNLIQFISYLKKDNRAQNYLNVNYPEIDFYNVEVYLENSLSVDSELKFFDAEKIDGRIKMTVNNQKFINLFTLDYLLEVVKDYSDVKSNVQQIAEKVVSFRINKA